MKRFSVSIGAVLAVALMAPLAAQAAHNPNHSPPGATPALSISAAPNPLVFGGATTVAGRLTGIAGNNNATVELQDNPYPYTRGYQRVATTQTNQQGDYAFTVRPGFRHRYRTVTTGLTGGATSAEYVVRVRLSVSFYISDSTPRRAQLIRLYGWIRPDHDNRRVLIQRRGTDGVFRNVASTLSRDVPNRTYSYYSRLLRVYSDGVYRVVPLSGDIDHLPGISAARLVNVS